MEGTSLLPVRPFRRRPAQTYARLAARNSSKLSFEGTSKDNFLAVDLDVTSKDSINKAFEAALKQFGQIE